MAAGRRTTPERAAEPAPSRRGGRQTTGVGAGGRERTTGRTRRRRSGSSGRERAAGGAEGKAVGRKPGGRPPTAGPSLPRLLPRPTEPTDSQPSLDLPSLSPRLRSPPLHPSRRRRHTASTQPRDGPATTSDGRTTPCAPARHRQAPTAGRLGERARSAERRGRSPGESARRQATPRRPAGRRRGTHPRGAAAHARLGLGPRRPPRHGEARRRGRARTPDARVGAPRRRRAGPRRDAAGGGRRTTAERTRPHHRRRPRPRGRGTVPAHRHPGGSAQRPLAARGRFPKGDRPRRPRGQGLVASSLSLSPPFSSRSRAARPRGRGAPRLHLGGRRAPAALRANPQPRHPREGARARTHTPGGRLIVKRRSDRRSPGRNPGPQVRSKCR